MIESRLLASYRRLRRPITVLLDWPWTPRIKTCQLPASVALHRARIEIARSV